VRSQGSEPFIIYLVREPSFDWSGRALVPADECHTHVSMYQFKRRTDYDTANRVIAQHLQPVLNAMVFETQSEDVPERVFVRTRSTNESGKLDRPWARADQVQSAIIAGDYRPEGTTFARSLARHFMPYQTDVSSTIYLLKIERVRDIYS
jgi:hypothetical protein